MQSYQKALYATPGTGRPGPPIPTEARGLASLVNGPILEPVVAMPFDNFPEHEREPDVQVPEIFAGVSGTVIGRVDQQRRISRT